MNKLLYLILLFFPFATYAEIYCSSSTGNDSWPGTQLQPVATINKALSMSDDVRLLCGDRFYANVTLSDACISSYGHGSKPQICGLKIPTGTNTPWIRGEVDAITRQWKPNKNGNIWKIDMSATSNFTGIYAPKNNLLNNVGGIVDLSNYELIESCKYKSLSELQQNFDICQAFIDKGAGYSYNDLYLYLDTDPNQLNIGFTAGENGLEIKNATITNVEVCYWGKHGISVGSDVSILNCTVHGIGGSYIFASGEQYGNGIEIWIPTKNRAENIIIDGCEIIQCMDAGITLQGRFTDDTPQPNANNITFSNNVIKNCGYGFELFDSRPAGSDLVPVIENCNVRFCRFVDNAKNTGFRYPSTKRLPRTLFGNCHLRFWNNYPETVRISNCHFSGAPYICMRADSLTAAYVSATLVNNRITLSSSEELIVTIPNSERPAEPYQGTQFIRPDAQTIESLRAQITQFRQITRDSISSVTILSQTSDGFYNVAEF